MRDVLEPHLAGKSGRLEAAVRLRDEMIDLRAGDARQGVAQVVVAARLDVQLALAVESKDAAFAEDGRIARKPRHVHDGVEILARREAARSGRFLRHAHEKSRRNLRCETETKHARSRRRVLVGDKFERDGL